MTRNITNDHIINITEEPEHEVTGVNDENTGVNDTDENYAPEWINNKIDHLVNDKEMEDEVHNDLACKQAQANAEQAQAELSTDSNNQPIEKETMHDQFQQAIEHGKASAAKGDSERPKRSTKKNQDAIYSYCMQLIEEEGLEAHFNFHAQF